MIRDRCIEIRTFHQQNRIALLDGVTDSNQHLDDSSSQRRDDVREPIWVGLYLARRVHFVRRNRGRRDRLGVDLR